MKLPSILPNLHKTLDARLGSSLLEGYVRNIIKFVDRFPGMWGIILLAYMALVAITVVKYA